MHNFIANGKFNLELQSGNLQFGWKLMIFLAVWPWNLTDNLEEQQGTSSKQHQALCIISAPYMNSNWSYGPETAKWGHGLSHLDLWPLTLTFCMDIVFVNGNHSWNFQDDTMTLSKRCDRRTDRQTDRQTDEQTEISVLRAAWSQLHNTMGELRSAFMYFFFLRPQVSGGTLNIRAHTWGDTL